MSYSPETGLVYLPSQEFAWLYADSDEYKPHPLSYSTGTDSVISTLSEDADIQPEELATLKGYLTAWDPVAAKPAWQVTLNFAWNGGVLATAGNLVFQGTADGEIAAYAADSGEKLWSAETQTGVMAAPVSYMVDGRQFVAVMAGTGGAFGLESGKAAAIAGVGNISRTLVYALDGKAELPPLPSPAQIERPPAHTASDEVVAMGKAPVP